MTIKLPSKATFWGIREPEFKILLLITYWFNGRALGIGGEQRRIGTHAEMPLKDMFQATQWTYETHETAHERLLANDILQEQYVCRRKIDWAPTEQGLRAIRDCLDGHEDEVRPTWADESDGGPLYGDPNETLVHRKGVEVAADLLTGMAWAYRSNGRPYGIEWYPETGGGDACHDLHVDTMDRIDDVGVEVITANNNLEYLVNKWERHASEDRTTFWIFDNRATACTLFNELHRRHVFFLDGEFNNAENWSAKAINRKLWRSAERQSGEGGDDIVHTITSLLEGDQEKIQTLFEEYYSNK